jgi:hypothetical protein
MLANALNANRGQAPPSNLNHPRVCPRAPARRPQRLSPAIRESPALNVLSIQSHGADGPVGNAASVVPMQRRGVEVWPVHTVQVSNHLG